VGGIVCFLEQDSLRLSRDRESDITGREADKSAIRQSVKQWYDDFGWRRNETGVYNDTALFSQQSNTAYGAYEVASHLSLVDRLSGGDFVLDAASGAIAHPEYLAYSWFYKYRVCVDISLEALREAQAKLEGTAAWRTSLISLFEKGSSMQSYRATRYSVSKSRSNLKPSQNCIGFSNRTVIFAL
jgi:hypothetical protein